MRKIIQSKKGFLFGSVVDMFAILLFVIIVFVFWIVFKMAAGAGGTAVNSINAKISDVTTFTTVQNHLRSPIMFDVDGDGTEERITVAELISYSKFDDSLRPIVKTNLEDFFNKHYRADIVTTAHTLTYWYLEIHYDSGTLLEIGSKPGRSSSSALKLYTTTFFIPSMDQETIKMDVLVIN